MRELAFGLLGELDVTVTVAGRSEDGPRTAVVDLAKLGPDDELRLWPGEDGAWILARNTRRAHGDVVDVEEAYRLTGVRALGFRRN